MRKRRLWYFALVAAVMLMLGACGDDDESSTTDSGAKYGGTLSLGLEGDLEGLDPHLTKLGWTIVGAVEQVYSTLTIHDDSLSPQAGLAESWDVSGDGKTYTFNLRKGVKFHNGRELEASDVKFSLERLTNPDIPAPYGSFLEPVQTVEAPEKRKVVITLSEPNASLLVNLSIPTMAVVPKEEVESRGDLNDFMSGSGPFKFKERTPGSRLLLEKNSDYYIDGRPYIDELAVLILSDETARTAALRTGDVDMIDNVPFKDVASLQGDSSISVLGGPSLNYTSWLVNVKKEPFDDVKVRQALAWGLNRQEVVDKGFDGLGRPLEGTALIPPYWAGSDKKIYGTDYDKAKQLLAEAGFPDGFKMELLTSVEAFYQTPISEVSQAEWRKIGIDADIVVKDIGTALDDWVAGNYDVFAIRWWGADFVDPDGGLTPQISCGGSFNFTFYCNESLDSILDQARVTSDVGERKRLYENAMTLFAEEAPYIHLLSLDRYAAVRSYVKGYRAMVSASNQTLKDVWLDK